MKYRRYRKRMPFKFETGYFFNLQNYVLVIKGIKTLIISAIEKYGINSKRLTWPGMEFIQLLMTSSTTSFPCKMRFTFIG